MIQIREIDHLVLRVQDLPRMLAFYCDVVGCSVEKRRDDLGLVHLRAGRSLIDFVTVTGKLGQMGGAPPGVEGRNLDHFCLRVEPFDADDLRAHLLSHGVTTTEVSSNFGAAGNGPSFYFKDPEGNTIEFKGAPSPH